ncbi:MAG: cytochrome c oxidase, subunit [Candidatus Angelobacter sp.]|nr:cytochrome c oxidase, subunit [Candidatus Angelobacter sp.]
MPKPTFTFAPDTTEAAPKLGGHGPSFPPSTGRGGDDWDNRPHGRRGPRDRLNRYRLGIGLAVLSIFILFIALTSAYIVRQGTGHVDTNTSEFVTDWKPMVIPGILWINTILLIMSSLSMEMARRQVFREPLVTEEWLGLGTPTRKASLPWLGVTFLLGIGFLIGQFVAWQQLHAQGIFLASNPSSSFFFLLTGTHALHLVGGVLALAWASLAGILAKPLESRQIATDVSAWYWHAMGLLWIYIFVLFHFVR